MSTSIGLGAEAVGHRLVDGVKWCVLTTSLAISLNTAAAVQIPADNGSANDFIPWSHPAHGSRSARALDRAIPVERQVKDLEENLGLTKAGLAALLGVSRPTLYSWGRGKEPREKRLLQLMALHRAMEILRDGAPEGEVPALWQHQRLPSVGQSFAEGMRAEIDPEAMAAEIVEMWERDASESGAIEAMFAGSR